MAELSISPQDIKSALDKFVDAYEPSAATAEEIGYVTETVTALPISRACLALWPTSCCASKTVPWVWQ